MFRANTISYVLFWFNLNIVELIHTLTSDKQVSRRLDIFFQLSSGLITRYISVHLSVIVITLMTKIMASANFRLVLQKYSTIWALRQNFAAGHIEDALHLTLLNQQRHVEFGHSNRTSSTSKLCNTVLTVLQTPGKTVHWDPTYTTTHRNKNVNGR